MRTEDHYAIYAVFAGMVLLLFAIFSKVYHGPYRVFVDAYLGDVGIVGFLYFILGTVFIKLTPVWKFIIISIVATVVELFQLTNIPLQMQLPKPFIFILGTSFDPNDFICYFIGLIIAVFIDILLLGKAVEKD